MRGLDFSSWQAVLLSLVGLLLVTLIGMGLRLIMMMTLQQRRERQNRQINERLKALIAAYKVLGGSFTGTLSVSPVHLRDLRRQAAEAEAGAEAGETAGADSAQSDRARRIRDAVEAALSDIVLFGTARQVELAATAMRDMAAGRTVELGELVVSLRDHVREVLDLGVIPADIVIPAQGPARPSGSSGGRGGQREGGGGRGGGGGGGMGGMGMGGGMGGGVAIEPGRPEGGA